MKIKDKEFWVGIIVLLIIFMILIIIIELNPNSVIWAYPLMVLSFIIWIIVEGRK